MIIYKYNHIKEDLELKIFQDGYIYIYKHINKLLLLLLLLFKLLVFILLVLLLFG